MVEVTGTEPVVVLPDADERSCQESEAVRNHRTGTRSSGTERDRRADQRANDIVTYKWIALGFIVGSLIGTAMLFIPMTKMPERIAFRTASEAWQLHSSASRYHHRLGAGHLDRVTAGALG